MSIEAERSNWMLLLGLVMLGVYGFLLIFLNQSFSLAAWLYSPGTAPLDSPAYYLSITSLGATFVAGFFILHAAAKAKRALPPVFLIVVFAILFGLITAFIRPFNSADVFDYIKEGWLQAYYHVNIYKLSLQQFAAQAPNLPIKTDPMFYAMSWPHVVSPYGFLFSILGQCIGSISNGSQVIALLLFKFINFLAFLACGSLIYQLSKRLTGDPSKALLPLYAFLWNPFILLHELSNAHNDLLMMFLMLLALHFLIAKQWLWVFPALVLSILIKYITAVTAPFILIYMIKHAGWKSVLSSIILGIVFALGLAWPYVQGGLPHFFATNIGQGFMAHHSLQATLLWFFYLLGLPTSPTLMRTILLGLSYGGFSFFLMIVGLRAWHCADYSEKDLLKTLTLVLAVFILLVSSKFWSWYLLMFYPLALMLPEKTPLRQISIVLTISHLLSFTFFAFHADNIALTECLMGISFVFMTLFPAGLYVLYYSKMLRQAEKDSLTLSEGAV